MLITTYELFKKHSFETSSVQFIFDILKNIKLFNLYVYFQNLDSIAYPHPAKYVQPRVHISAYIPPAELRRHLWRNNAYSQCR